MPLPTGTPAAPERRPGDFRRAGPNGPPIVASTTKTRQPKGNRPELAAKAEAAGIDPEGLTVAQLKERLGPEPADEIYGRPSGFGDDLDDPWNLVKWKERQVALGIAMRPDLLDRMQGIDPEDERRTLDGIVAAAHDTAGSHMAADRGTFVHLLTEIVEERPSWSYDSVNWPKPDPAFGLTTEMCGELMGGWDRLVIDNGLEVLATEATVVNDSRRLAGTLDRLCRTTKPLTFTYKNDDTVTVPAGTVLVVDIKTSDLRDKGDGFPNYWLSYPTQVLAYAEARPYDPDSDERGEW